MKTIQLCGKINGDPNWVEKFMCKDAEFMKQGYNVINPAVIKLSLDVIYFKKGVGEPSYEDYLELCLQCMIDADEVFFFKDWKVSPGAIREHEKALRLGLKIIYESEED